MAAAAAHIGIGDQSSLHLQQNIAGAVRRYRPVFRTARQAAVQGQITACQNQHNRAVIGGCG